MKIIINILLINIFAALATGGAVVAAQFVGQGTFDKARHAAKQLILITAIISLFMMVIVIIFNTLLLHLIFGNVLYILNQISNENSHLHKYLNPFALTFLKSHNKLQL